MEREMPCSDLRNRATPPAVSVQETETPRALQPRWERVSSHSSMANETARYARKILDVNGAQVTALPFPRGRGRCGNGRAADYRTQSKMKYKAKSGDKRQ